MQLLLFSTIALSILCVALFVLVCIGVYYLIRYYRVKESLIRAWFLPPTQGTIKEPIIKHRDWEPALREDLSPVHSLYMADLINRLQLHASLCKTGQSSEPAHPLAVVSEWSHPQYIHHPPLGYTYLRGDGTPIIVFRGTSTKEEMEQDFQMNQVDFVDRVVAGVHGKVHHGFYQLYQKVAPSLEIPFPTIYVAGYSLGSALAVFLGIDLAYRYPDKSIFVTTFASPRLGDLDFDEFVSSLENLTIWNIGNRADLIRDVPPTITPNISDEHNELTFIYKHTGKSWDFDTVKESLQENHNLDTYIEALQRAGTK